MTPPKKPRTTTSSGEPRMWSVTELAEFLGISRRTMEVWVAEGKTPPITRLGGRGMIRFRDNDVQDWLAAQRENTPTRYTR